MLVFLSAGGFAVKYFVGLEKTKHLVRDSRNLLSMARASSELLAFWRSGDPAMLAPFCRDLFDPTIRYSDHYFRCNPDYMKCLLTQRSKFDEVEVHWHRIVPASSSRNWSLALKLTHDNHSETLILEDSCTGVELPQRRFSFNANGKEIRWDNFDRHIYIDRYPVSFRDIQEWQEATGMKLQNLNLDELAIRQRHLAVQGLNAQEMRSYCRYRGKRLATAQIFEAASYHPRDRKKVRPSRIVKTPYPWSIYRKSDFLFKARKNRINVTHEDCRKAYVKECTQLIEPENYNDGIPTWSGVFDTIGGVPEYFENEFNPKQNFFVSNVNLPASSLWHELGKYAYWNGEGFTPGDFDLGKVDADLSFPLQPGFRCMEER